MQRFPCPFCGPRDETEFHFAAEAGKTRPEPAGEVGAERWAEYLHLKKNPKGIHFERWRHIHGCGRFFNAVRHTVTDKFVTTYPAGEGKPDLSSPELAAKVAEASR